MRVTPLDIRRKEFKRSMRGYSDEEVDVFLDEVADEFERVFQENMELNDRLQRLEEQIAGYVQIKDTLEKTLISAQLQADQVQANARKEGELILRDAELKARHIVNDSYGETQRVQQALTQLKHLEEDFRFKFRSLLEGHLKLLHDVPISVAGPEPAVPEEGAPAPVAAGADGDAVAAEASASQPEEGPVTIFTGPESADPTDAMEPPEQSVPPADGPGEVFASAGLVAPPDDDIPTAENEAEAAAEVAPTQSYVSSPVSGAEEPTMETPDQRSDQSSEGGLAETTAAETSPGPADSAGDAEEEEPPIRGFYFGRRLDEGDEDFLAPDPDKRGKGRDFEW